MTKILPAAITKRATWDGTSPHPHNARQRVANLDSKMPWAEHQRIVAEGMALLAADAVPEIFQYLRAAFHGALCEGRTTIVYVSKGIHQPETNPHMQLETESKLEGARPGAAPFIRRYHMVVSAVPSEKMDDRFQWKGVQFTCTDDDDMVHSFPAGIVPLMKSPAATRGRRNSVTTADLEEHVRRQAAIAADLAAAQAFDALCTAFENTHAIKPIDRAIRTVVWGMPTHTGFARVGAGTIKFQYDRTNKLLKLAA